MLELLLGHEPRLFAGGVLELDISPAAFTAAAVAIAAGVAALTFLAPAAISLTLARRLGLWALRSALLIGVVFLLLDPRMQVLEREAVRGHVAVVLDDSLSMQIRDLGGGSRGQQLLARFAPGEGDVARALEQRFDVRYLRFANQVKSLLPGEGMDFAGSRSHLDLALDRLAELAGGGGLASVIIVTDGAGAGEGIPRAQDPGFEPAAASVLNALAARNVVVHTVGLGKARFDLDLELSDALLPQQVLRGDALSAQVSIVHRGVSGRLVTLRVERDAVLVAELPVTLSSSGRTRVEVPLRFMDAGARRLLFRVQPVAGEVLHENNQLTRMVQVRDAPIQVLHMEGEPRFEVKFLRRAVAGDDGIRLRSLIRTAENKFYRLGVDDASELPHGLPATDEALFRYDAVVIGSLGQDLLDADQQRRLQAFVARRGGGLVMLGGRQAFAEGGYSAGPLAALSPVVIPAAASSYRSRVRITPVVAPAAHPLLRVAPEDELEQAWSRLPALTMVNPIRVAKPGATVLLRGEDDGAGELVALAWHRYGRGTVAAFPVRDSWRWQMHADVPLDDMSHELLWRALLRHVARPAGGRLRMNLSRCVAAVGDTVRVSADSLGADYRPRERSSLALAVTTPGGAIERVPLSRAGGAAGAHGGSFVVAVPGRYELALTDEDADGATRVLRAGVEVSSTGQEFHASELDEARLARIAAATGGTFRHADSAMGLVDRVDDTRGYREVSHDLSLRRVPAILILMLMLAGSEWLWRRRCALP